MNILQVIPYFVPAWDYGGPVQVAYRISRELAARGHEVTVYTTDVLDAGNRTGEKAETIDGIRVKRFSNISNTLAYRTKVFLSPGMIRAVRGELSNFDVVHMHEYRTLQNALVHYYARKYGVPYVLQAHGSLPVIAARQKLKRLYDNLWGNKLLRDAARTIALTETESGQYRSMGAGENQMAIVPNGIDLPEFENLPERGAFRKKHGLQDKEKVVLYLGRIHKTKGIDLLIRAFAGVVKECENARLVIVGPDEGHSSELTRMAGDMGIGSRVLFTGAVYGAAKLEAYVDADVFVTPSFLGFPVTFIEALACGTPIITTDNGARLDWIDNQTGYVVGYSETQLKDAMIKILNNPDSRRQFGENGKKLVRERFNWAKIVETLEQVYFDAKGI